MVWLAGAIGFLLGAAFVWFLARSGAVRFGILGTVDPGEVTRIGNDTIRVPFTAIQAPGELSGVARIRAKTFHGAFTPVWDDCASVGSVSPAEVGIDQSDDDRVVIYGAFQRVSGAGIAPIPSASGSSSEDSSSKKSILP